MPIAADRQCVSTGVYLGLPQLVPAGSSGTVLAVRHCPGRGHPRGKGDAPHAVPSGDRAALLVRARVCLRSWVPHVKHGQLRLMKWWGVETQVHASMQLISFFKSEAKGMSESAGKCWCAILFRNVIRCGDYAPLRYICCASLAFLLWSGMVCDAQLPDFYVPVTYRPFLQTTVMRPSESY